MFGKTHYRDGGTRGGAAQFSWEKVAGDQNYLGACVNAPRVGRRDLDRDWFWYTRKKDTFGRELGEAPEVLAARRRLEVLERKRADDEALADALGETAESRSRKARAEVEMAELKKLVERGGMPREGGFEAERVAGLGAAPAKRHDHVMRDSRVAREVERQEKARRERELLVADAARRRAVDPTTLVDATAPEQGFVHDATNDRPLEEEEEDDDDNPRKRRRREKKKEAKRLRKEAKKARKKRARKKEKRGDDDDDAPASSASEEEFEEKSTGCAVQSRGC
ncbi:hypothetical protein CTAYLR_005245 [Chrysophaeum taylorii]|uniref:Multiple myeloma tumor-associated protein 2-like N-terminal domain-containing protein n=1 Tax=Chrysophaeum taylorii TaxID=2483200 RepID=A0AAD7UBU6_9STRA|nr:hypothetical protein CTAYLR_005245 [Chrysophaeum taylorii]